MHITLDTNKVFYIGKGKGRRANVSYARNIHWQRVVNKHGFRVEILTNNLTEPEAFALEVETIAKYGLENLTNLTVGGEGVSGNIPWNKGTKGVQPGLCGELNPMFGKVGELNPMFGVRHSDEAISLMKEKLSDGRRKGDKHIMYGKRGEKSPLFGKKHSAEWKLKQSMTALSKKGDHHNAKGVIQLKDGVEIARFYSVTHAQEVTNISRRRISEVCSGKRAISGGFSWKFLN